jgi:hypothetical protein
MPNLSPSQRAIGCALVVSCAAMCADQVAAQVAAPPAPAAPAAATDAKLPSLHIRCDGNPPHMSDAESFARLVGAVTLLALFAPRPETPAPDKRVFADAGVAICSQLLDDPDHREKNTLRRLPLLLARAAHNIEAKHYDKALADVVLARSEAAAQGLTANPYFQRSMGLSLDRFEAAARIRMGDATGARDAGLAAAAAAPYSFVPVMTGQDFGWANRKDGGLSAPYFAAADRMVIASAMIHANRLEDQGQFAAAASLREAVIARAQAFATDSKNSAPLADAAITHALAGDWARANARAEEARANLDARDAAGKPENDRASVVEKLDFLGILQLVRDGRLDQARRLLGARSEWSWVSYGARFTLVDALRKDAPKDQLTGILATSSDEQWDVLRRRMLATLLQSDTNNRSLFSNILTYAKVDDYERLSKIVWSTEKSRLLGKEPIKDSHFYNLSLAAVPVSSPLAQMDALMLHAALLAKARGFTGFAMVAPRAVGSWMLVAFGNPGDADTPTPMFLDANKVIAELRQIIPTPDEVATRQAERDKAAQKKS